MKFLIFTNEVDALAFQLRGDMVTGYPHGLTTHAQSVEKHYNQDRWACSVSTVWSWAHGRQYDMEGEMLSSGEVADLKSFQYLIDEEWFPPE